MENNRTCASVPSLSIPLFKPTRIDGRLAPRGNFLLLTYRSLCFAAYNLSTIFIVLYRLTLVRGERFFFFVLKKEEGERRGEKGREGKVIIFSELSLFLSFSKSEDIQRTVYCEPFGYLGNVQ